MDAQAMYLPISSLKFYKPITAETGTSVSDVILLMQEGDSDHVRGIGCVLVVEEKSLVGIITERCIFPPTRPGLRPTSLHPTDTRF